MCQLLAVSFLSKAFSPSFSENMSLKANPFYLLTEFL